MNIAEFRFQGKAIPDYMQDALKLYLEQHIDPGHFLCAVLSNDLKEAVNRADDTNINALPIYVAYLYNHAPSKCWGSTEKVNKWLANR